MDLFYLDENAGVSSLLCQRYAHIQETGNGKRATICGGEQRIKNVYMSNSHQVQVEIVPKHHGTQTAAFLLQYKGTQWLISLIRT